MSEHFFFGKNCIDLIKNMFKSVDLLFNKFNEFQCKISNFAESLFTPSWYRFNRSGCFFTSQEKPITKWWNDLTRWRLTLLLGLVALSIGGGYLLLHHHIKWNDDMALYELFLYRVLFVETLIPRVIIPIAYIATRKDVQRFFWINSNNCVSHQINI